MEITPDSNNVAGSGLIGLGPAAGSNILSTLNSSAGSPPLDMIFGQNTSTPNFLTILLNRSDDPDEVYCSMYEYSGTPCLNFLFQPFPGDLSVGEVLPGYDSITSQPKLDVSTVSSSSKSGQHWQTLLDSNGVIGPDGNAISISSVVSGASDKSKATVIFDSGFSLPQVPKSVIVFLSLI